MADIPENTHNIQNTVQELAAFLHTASGMHIGIHDIDRLFQIAAGNTRENLCRFCKNNCNGFSDKCRSCDAEHLTEVNQFQEKVIYRCHLGLTEAIIPVKDAGRLIGVLFLGQVIILPDESMSFENIYKRLAAEYPDNVSETNRASLENAYRNTPAMTMEKLESFIGLATFAEKGIHVNHWLDHAKISTETLVKQYINLLDLEHIPLTEFSVSTIAKRMNISYSQLNRISISLYGMPLKQYVLERKIHTAAVLLHEQPNLLVSDVAERIGIENANYFSKLFKKYMGYTCSAYRAGITE